MRLNTPSTLIPVIQASNVKSPFSHLPHDILYTCSHHPPPPLVWQHPWMPLSKHIHHKCIAGVEKIAADNWSLPVPTNGHTLKDAISISGNDIVKFIGHSSRTRYISDTPWTVELRWEDVIQHSTSVTNLEAAWFDTTHLQRHNPL